MFFALISLLFGAFKAYFLVSRLDTSFNQNIFTNHYTQSDVINSIEVVKDVTGKTATEKKFNVAVGVFSYGLNIEPNFVQYLKLQVKNLSFVEIKLTKPIFICVLKWKLCLNPLAEYRITVPKQNSSRVNNLAGDSKLFCSFYCHLHLS